MAMCPICQSELEITAQHYGALYTCPKCSAVFFVDWEGRPETAANDTLSGETSKESTDEMPGDQEASGGKSLIYSEAPGEEDFVLPVETPPEEMPTFEESPSTYDFSQPLEAQENPSQSPPEPVENDDIDLSEIADFGNADLGQAAFNYTFTISGIDSGSIRAQIEEALSDSKFNWNVIQLMAQINGGVLTIQSLNAVKASILMQRVKYLPVKVSWRQNVLSGAI